MSDERIERERHKRARNSTANDVGSSSSSSTTTAAEQPTTSSNNSTTPGSRRVSNNSSPSVENNKNGETAKLAKLGKALSTSAKRLVSNNQTHLFYFHLIALSLTAYKKSLPR